VVFARELLRQCIGVLAEHRGAALLQAMDEKDFARVVLSPDAKPSEWLASFADLHDLLGCGNCVCEKS
ncbi:MAG: hypothetical protein IKC14_09295, partial [Kiritimatiellae bacterium]|nr:hypothetical protein [Kiritimatiellia bacterium]